MSDIDVDKIINKAYDILGVPNVNNLNLPKSENIVGWQIADNDIKLKIQLIKINTRESMTKYPKKLRRAWKNYKRKLNKYYKSL